MDSERNNERFLGSFNLKNEDLEEFLGFPDSVRIIAIVPDNFYHTTKLIVESIVQGPGIKKTLRGQMIYQMSDSEFAGILLSNDTKPKTTEDKVKKLSKTIGKFLEENHERETSKIIEKAS